MSLTSRIIGRLWHLPAPASRDIVAEPDIRVSVRDGTELLLDRYYPRGGGHLPVILIRNPYGRDNLFAHLAVILAERGFQVLLQSCRGTGGSGGILHPSFNEEHDGSDTIDWIGRQPWFCGSLALLGSSYSGNAAWAAAHGAGSKIGALALHVTLSDSRAETYAFGGFTLEACLKWTRTVTQPERFGALPFLIATMLPQKRDRERMQLAFSSLPLRDADEVAVGCRTPWWQDWVEHAEPGDPFWTPIDYSTVAASAPPTAMIGGWHNVFLPWQVNDFEAMQAAGREASLTIGPWRHADLDALGETVRQALPLFREILMNAPAPPRLPVRLFVLGANQWRQYQSWPPPGFAPVVYYLSPGGGLSTRLPPPGPPGSYDYDPSHPTPAVNGPTLQGGPALGDMAKLESRSDVLLFTGEPLEAAMEVIGPVWAQLFFKSSLAHTDFFLCLCDMDSTGRSTNVCDGYLRIRPNHPAPLSDGTLRVRIDFWPTAYRYRRGHRLRLIVASGAHPRYARNPGSGEPLADAVTFKVAHQEIFHDPSHPTQIVLPIAACPASGFSRPHLI